MAGFEIERHSSTSCYERFFKMIKTMGKRRSLVSMCMSLIFTAFLIELGYLVIVKEILMIEDGRGLYDALDDNETDDWLNLGKFSHRLTIFELNDSSQKILHVIQSQNISFPVVKEKSVLQTDKQPWRMRQNVRISVQGIHRVIKPTRKPGLSHAYKVWKERKKQKIRRKILFPSAVATPLIARKWQRWRDNLELVKNHDHSRVKSFLQRPRKRLKLATPSVLCLNCATVTPTVSDTSNIGDLHTSTPRIYPRTPILQLQNTEELDNETARIRIPTPKNTLTWLHDLRLARENVIRQRSNRLRMIELRSKDWNDHNNHSVCREWRLVRQNWTAIITGRTVYNVSLCPNPYITHSVKRIVFSNLTEEYLGCTRYTSRCEEHQYFSDDYNMRINLPPCCRRNLIEIYKNIENELNNLGVEHFMIGGGVIGWMRNGRSVPYDDDLDILVPMPFWKSKKFWELVSRLKRNHGHMCRLVEKTKMKIYLSIHNKINVDMWPFEILTHTFVKKRVKIIPRKRQKGVRKKRKRKKILKRGFSNDIGVNRRPRSRNDVIRMGRKKRRRKRLRPRTKIIKIRKKLEVPVITIPYKRFVKQPVRNLLPPKQVVFENFLVYIPNNPVAYLDLQYGVDNWREELTCQDVDSDNTCTS